MPRDIYSTDPGPRTTDPRKVLVDPSTLGRVQRAMSGQCHECRGGKRKSMVANTLVKCELCNGTGRRDSYGLAQISSAAALTTSKVLDALSELQTRGVVSIVSVDGQEMWRLVRR